MHNITKRSAVLSMAFVLATVGAVTAYAAGLTNKKVTLGNENPSQSTSYNFTFTAGSATTIKRVEIQFGTTQGGTTLPTGMTTTGASLASTSNLGSGGTWAGSFGTNGLLSIANAANTGTPAAGITANFNSITNSSSTGTYYARITSYDAATGGTAIDQDDVAFPIANSSVNVTASVGETLSYSLSANSIALGTLNNASTSTGSHTMTVSTNAQGGYAITGQGNQLTAGSNTIPFTTDSAVTTGQSEYGVAFSGATGHPAGDRDLTSSQTVASSSAPANAAQTTATYKASIAGTQAAGNYTSTVTYVATATF